MTGEIKTGSREGKSRFQKPQGLKLEVLQEISQQLICTKYIVIGILTCGMDG